MCIMICIDNKEHEDRFTIGKEYKILEYSEYNNISVVIVEDDKKSLFFCDRNRFISIDMYRESRIEKLFKSE